MQPDLADLDTYLADHDCDAYLVKAASTDSDQRYLSGFDAPDDFVTCYTGGDVHLLVSGLEYGRATKESHAAPDDVARYADYDYRAKVEEHGPKDAFPHVLREFLADLDVDAAAVPGDFPVALADDLRDAGLTLTPDTDGVVTDIRAIKTDTEVEHVHAAQKANEAAMRTAETLVADATVEDGVLHHDGDALTSERVKEAIEITLLRNGCSLDETIVACGSDGADPHNRGSGPLHADQPIVVDIFPRDKDTKYHADMTRTFCKGTPTDEQQRRYEITEEAFHAAMDQIEPGTPASDVHAAVCDVYEDHGYPTLRSDQSTETGFIHSTGHGVGLDVHEGPAISDGSDDTLQPGHVITIEPGLYHPDHGGVRIEDLVVVTEDGYRNLTDYPISFTPESRQ